MAAGTSTAGPKEQELQVQPVFVSTGQGETKGPLGHLDRRGSIGRKALATQHVEKSLVR